MVGTGTAGSCTQTALNACLPGGGSFDGSVTFQCGAAAHTIAVTATKTISANTSIDGGGLITIDGGDAVRVFSVDFPRTLTLQNLTIANGQTAVGESGGAIENFGTVNATNCTFIDNSTTGGGDGGAIENNAATLNATGCTFNGNFTRSGGGGGAIDNNGGTANVTSCTFDQNTAQAGNGGAILNNGGDLDVSGSTFNRNIAAEGNGGAIYNDGGDMNVTTSTFTANGAEGNGGGILTNGGTCTVTQTTFDRNFTGEDSNGGGIYCNGSTLTLANSTLTRNDADGDGGGLYFDGTNITIKNVTLSNNEAQSGDNIFSNGARGSVTNTIVAGGSGNCSGSIPDSGNNIDDGTSCGFSTMNGSLPATNPALDPTGLADNGGPTQTIALCTGAGAPALCTSASPAINAADNATCASSPVNGVDQRAFLRFPPGNPVCDIGAFEANSFAGVPAQARAPALSAAALIALMLALFTVGTGLLRRPRV
jgi:predicted outer membrane repeat protein